MQESHVDGGCLCGSIRYRITAPLMFAEHCHCAMCRKAHGAAFSTNTVVPTDALHIASGADLLSEYESSPNRRKCFCSRCGSQLFIRRTNRPEMTVVTLGSIDGTPAVRPERHVFVGSKASWYDIDDVQLPRTRSILEASWQARAARSPGVSPPGGHEPPFATDRLAAVQ